jgi:hypothetical protein
MTDRPWGPLPEAEGNFSTRDRRRTFIDVEVLGTVTVGGDVLLSGTLRTAFSTVDTKRIEITDDSIWFYTGDPDENTAGRIYADDSVSTDPKLTFSSPSDAGSSHFMSLSFEQIKFGLGSGTLEFVIDGGTTGENFSFAGAVGSGVVEMWDNVGGTNSQGMKVVGFGSTVLMNVYENSIAGSNAVFDGMEGSAPALRIKGDRTSQWWASGVTFEETDTNDIWQIGMRGANDTSHERDLKIESIFSSTKAWMTFDEGADVIEINDKDVHLHDASANTAIYFNPANGAIELFWASGPYIDFKNATADDHDVRIRLVGDDAIQIQGGNLQMASTWDYQNVSPTTVTGTADADWVNVSGSIWEIRRHTSSKRYKKDIDYDVAEYLANVKLKPVSFYAKAEDDDARHWGFIAEDFRKQNIEFVKTNSRGWTENFYNDAVLAVMAAKINRLEDEVRELRMAA